MFSYYVVLGIRSLLSQRLITMWMILLIALGVAGTVSTFSLLRAVSSNAFAAKAHQLFTPQIDNHGPDYVKTYGIAPVLTLRDVEALRAHDGARLQAAIYQINLSLVPADTTIDALTAKGYMVSIPVRPIVSSLCLHLGREFFHRAAGDLLRFNHRANRKSVLDALFDAEKPAPDVHHSYPPVCFGAGSMCGITSGAACSQRAAGRSNADRPKLNLTTAARIFIGRSSRSRKTPPDPVQSVASGSLKASKSHFA